MGIVDCGKLVPSYIHTVAGTAGGSVTTPDWGTFIYDGAMVVDFVAPLDAGYRTSAPKWERSTTSKKEKVRSVKPGPEEQKEQ